MDPLRITTTHCRACAALHQNLWRASLYYSDITDGKTFVKIDFFKKVLYKIFSTNGHIIPEHSHLGAKLICLTAPPTFCSFPPFQRRRGSAASGRRAGTARGRS